MEPLTCVSGNVGSAHPSLYCRAYASMEPLTCVSGNAGGPDGVVDRGRRFNGAAHLRERKHGGGGFGPVGVRLASMEPLTCVSGNDEDGRWVWVCRDASMEPLTCVSGNRRRRRGGRRRRTGFNGAAHLRERKRELRADALGVERLGLQWSRSPA